MYIQAHRIETTLEQDGTLTLSDLPFQAGESVEVIILTHEPAPQQQVAHHYSLRGMPIRYDDPTDPVAQDDWHSYP